MKYKQITAFLLLLILPEVFAEPVTPAHRKAAKMAAGIPILHEGRVKPVDTFAEVHLLIFYGKRSTKELTASEWLLELLLDPLAADERKIFNIRNADIAEALNLEARKEHYYSFNEIWPGIQSNMAFLRQAYEKDPEMRDLVERQLLELYNNLSRYIEIGKSMPFLQKVFSLESEKLAAAFGLAPGEQENLLFFQGKQDVFAKFVEEMKQKEEQEIDRDDAELVNLAQNLDRVRRQEQSSIFQVVPPKKGAELEQWSPLWSGQSLSERDRKFLSPWETISDVYLSNQEADIESFKTSIANLYDGHNRVRLSMLNLEVHNNKLNLFYKSAAFYILSFLLIIISWAVWSKPLRIASFASLIIGLLLHAAGIFIRMLIMGRPPVSTLYESVIFVGFVCVLTCAIYEMMKRNSLGTFSGATLGAVFHFVGFGYAADGDTMGMLVAVLDSNFWLATHVVTIAIGYGCAFVAGFIGHLYLFFKIFQPKDKERLRALAKNMLGASLIALFFTLFGTILGGIWADQSWGRFWGWDPKENGALLIILWLLILMHGKVAGKMKENGFAFGLIINNIIVALAWFGVNLLNIGLHSYGFTESIFLKLGLFCGLELLFGAVAYSIVKWRRHS
ncbi:MAG: hypothetical protein CSA81_06095 [Acidobacteria bacterium]|nr:MAG: hypothetical protein CSA81_06095 [Acidobacteriota bacterium]PIE89626.1 MAG: hypothetical protein CR997_10455 [Acidobacteriota bacterium]